MKNPLRWPSRMPQEPSLKRPRTGSAPADGSTIANISGRSYGGCRASCTKSPGEPRSGYRNQFLASAAILALAGYGWRAYTLFRDWQMNMPQPQIDKLVKDLRVYHARAGRFPNTFTEVNDLIWRTKPSPNYGRGGRQARTRNYYYFHTKVDNRTCAIWALPTGPQRHYASSFFLVLSPDWARNWKGKALTDDVIRTLPGIPNPDQLAALTMREMPARIFKSNVCGSTRKCIGGIPYVASHSRRQDCKAGRSAACDEGHSLINTDLLRARLNCNPEAYGFNPMRRITSANRGSERRLL
jgi:hypothetical protein